MGIGKKLEQLSVKEDLFPELSSVEKATNKLLAKIASKIYRRRKQLGMTQKQLSDRLNVSQPMVSQWESGECNFTIESLVEILDTLNMNVDLVFTPVGPVYMDNTWSTPKPDKRPEDYWKLESEAA